MLRFYASITSDKYRLPAFIQQLSTTSVGLKPFSNVLLTPLNLSKPLLNQYKDWFSASDVLFDSGSFSVQIGKKTYQEVLDNIIPLYTAHPWASYYTLPDHIPVLSDDDDTVEEKVNDTIRNSVHTFHKLPDALKPKAMPVIQGRTLDHIHRCLDAYFKLGVKKIGFGAFQNKPSATAANTMSRSSVAVIEYINRICNEEGVNLHLFGVGSPRYAVLFKGLNVGSFDTNTWSVSAGYGLVFYPLTKTFAITDQKTAFMQRTNRLSAVLTKELHEKLKERTNHHCPFCEDYERLKTDTNARRLHNLICLTESVERVNNENMETLNAVYQANEGCSKNDVLKYLDKTSQEYQREKIKRFKQLQMTFRRRLI